MAIGAIIGAIVNQVTGSIAEGQIRRAIAEENNRLWPQMVTQGRTRPFVIGRPGAYEEPRAIVPAVRTDTGQEGYRIVDVSQLQQPGETMVNVVGRPPLRPPRMPPIAGATEFTAPIGPPSMEPRVIVAQTPPNQQTPRDGVPGGSFNYNSLLASTFKWDLQTNGFAANPGVGNEVASLLITRAGVYSVEAIVSSDATLLVTTRQLSAGVSNTLVTTFTGVVPVQLQEILIWPEIRPFPALSTFAVFSGAAAAGNYAFTIRAKQLASL